MSDGKAEEKTAVTAPAEAAKQTASFKTTEGWPKPTQGRIVLFYGLDSNGCLEHPAIITRIWADDCVNLTVFPDNAAPQTRTSVMMKGANGRNHSTYWRWPPRTEALEKA